MIIAHDFDPDGNAAGWLLQKAFNAGVLRKKGITEDSQLKIHPVDYVKGFPLDEVEDDEAVFILDYSIPTDIMDKLLDKTPNVFWIDHHLSSINTYKDYARMDEIKGLRDLEYASCQNVWRFLFENEKFCPAISLIGDYDTWAWQKKDRRECLHYILGVQTEDIGLTSGNWENFNTNWEEFIQKGETIDGFQREFYKGLHEKMFTTTLEGKKTLALNAPIRGALVFEDYPDKKNYDVLMVYHFNGTSYSASIFTEKDAIDVSVIAKKLGGGGHMQAAGFTQDSLPFDLPTKDKRTES